MRQVGACLQGSNAGGVDLCSDKQGTAEDVSSQLLRMYQASCYDP